MARLFLECTIRAALIVIGTAIVFYAMRVRVAAVKHRVWTAVLLLMLALPLWTAWGPKAEFRLLPASVERAVTQTAPAIPAIPQSGVQVAPPINGTAPAKQPLLSRFEEALLGFYLLGAFVLLTRLGIGTAKANRLIRESVESDGIRTNARCVAPVTVGCLRPTVILPETWRNWSGTQLAVVMAHEGEHVRRRDPLVQWLALLNRAIFWFHPAAWWLERELSALAEEACDAAVIAQGHDPRDYAEILMNIARDVMDSGSRINSVAVAMPGARLPERVRTIMDAAPIARMSRVRAAGIVLLCAVVFAALLGVTLARAQDGATEDWEKAAGGKMVFDVASVKPNVSSDHASDNNVPFFGDRFPENGGLFSAKNTAISLYVAFAYKLSRTQFQALNSEMPKWAANARFDIQARAPAGTTKDQMRLMMQSLLANRFQLKAHFEMRDTPVYLLELVKSGVTGPKLRPHTDDPPCADPSVPDVSNGALITTPLGFPMRCGSPTGFVNLKGASYSGRNISMQTIADSFIVAPNNPTIDRPVIDRTGLTGNYDFVVNYWPQSNSTSSPPDDAGPVLSEAVKRDLGLKLEATTAPFKKLIIDHIEEPTPN